jgi:choice-of-anchor C domain-containing protein
MKGSAPTLVLHAFLVALIAAAVSPLRSQANLVVNGSFENGPPIDGGRTDVGVPGGSTLITGWLVTGAGVDFISSGFGTPSDGVRMVDLNGTTTGGIQQVVTSVAPGDYVLLFDIAGSPNIGPRSMRASAAGQSADFTFDGTNTSGGNMGWATHSLSFQLSSASSVLVDFTSLSPTEWGVIIDNVRLFDATYRTFGSGCLGSNGVPNITPNQPPRIGQPFSFIATQVPLNQLALVVFGFSRDALGSVTLPLLLDSYGMPGCSLFASPDIIFTIADTGPFGAFVWGISLPSEPRAIGIPFFNQVFAGDPGSNPAGLVSSNAGAGVVGG